METCNNYFSQKNKIGIEWLVSDRGWPMTKLTLTDVKLIKLLAEIRAESSRWEHSHDDHRVEHTRNWFGEWRKYKSWTIESTHSHSKWLRLKGLKDKIKIGSAMLTVRGGYGRSTAVAREWFQKVAYNMVRLIRRCPTTPGPAALTPVGCSKWVSGALFQCLCGLTLSPTQSTIAVCC